MDSNRRPAGYEPAAIDQLSYVAIKKCAFNDGATRRAQNLLLYKHLPAAAYKNEEPIYKNLHLSFNKPHQKYRKRFLVKMRCRYTTRLLTIAPREKYRRTFREKRGAGARLDSLL